VRSSWLVGVLVTIASLIWTGGATAHVGERAAAADCCYEISYDQYEQVYIWYVANGNRANMQGAYRATMEAHVRMLATAVTSPEYIHFLVVTEERAAAMDEVDGAETRTPAPNPNAQPGPWKDAPDCYPTDAGSQLSYPNVGGAASHEPPYARDAGTNGGLVRIDRKQKRTEVVLGPPIRNWKFTCAKHYHGVSGGSGEGAYPVSTFNSMSLSGRSESVLPLVNSDGKAAVCHVAGYQQVSLLGGDELYQFKGTYSASIRIRKVPSGARKDEVRKLGKLAKTSPQWMPGIFIGDPGATGDIGPLSPSVPRTGCSRR
jgi:hypothetical protein